MSVCRGPVLFLCLMLMAMAVRSETPFSRASACAEIDRYGSDMLCGIWQLGGDGATVAILPEKGSSAKFRIVLVDSPDMSLMPGSVLGAVVTTGKAGTYDAEFFSSKGLLKRPKKFIITIGEDGRLTFNSYKQGKQVSLWRWLPYLYRVTISDRDTRPSSADGAVRVYPDDRSSGPVVL